MSRALIDVLALYVGGCVAFWVAAGDSLTLAHALASGGVALGIAIAIWLAALAAECDEAWVDEIGQEDER